MNNKNKIIFLILILLSFEGLRPGFASELYFHQKLLDSCYSILDSADKFALKGDYIKFSQLIKQSHDLKKQLFTSKDPALANSMINLAISYRYVWNFDSALYYLNQAENIYSSMKSGNGYLGYIYTLCGNIYYNMNDLDLAERYYTKAEQFLQDKEEEPFLGIKITLFLWYGELKKMRGDFASSSFYYQKCLHIIENNTAYNNQLISYLMGFSDTYTHFGYYKKSIEVQLKAIELCKKDSANNILKLTMLFQNIAQNFVSLTEYKIADKFFNNALVISHKAGLTGYYPSKIWLDMGDMESKRNNYIKALDYYQSALKALIPSFLSHNPFDNPNIKSILAQLPALEIFKSRANCLYKIYLTNKKFEYLDAAINTSILSIDLIEALRNGYLSYESKIQLEGQEDATYKTALALCDEAYSSTRNIKYSELAFTISEKNKSAVLLSGLRELKAKNFGEIPDTLLGKENQLMKEITFYKEKIYEENKELKPDSIKIKTWDNYLFSKQRDYDQLVKSFERKYPGYYSLKYKNEVINTNELQNALPRNTTLVEYAISDSMLYTFVLSKGSYHFISQKIDSSFFLLMTDYLKEYHQFDFSKQYYSHFTEFCWKNKQVYDWLIKPVAPYIKGENLIIAPDGILSFLPFETLIDDIPKSFTQNFYKDLNYLLFKYNISYAYSSTFYGQVKDQKVHRNLNRLLAFAPEYGPNASVDLQTRKMVTREKYRKDLFPIPGVMDEVAAIKSLIPTDVYSGDIATESNFKKVAGNYDILHLAMHTVIDNKDPMYSKLVFTQINDSINDGLLNTSEIFGLKLKAKMVVLSACSTGDGGYNKGEGVVSLARGFVYAGCPSLLMTLWEVEDQSSVTLMKNFYINLLKGESKSQALRDAKIKFIKEAKAENSHPFFWSSCVLMGNTDAIYYSVWIIILPVALLLLIAVGIIILIVRRKRIRNFYLS